MAGTLKVATVGSLRYTLCIHHLRSELGLEINGFKGLKKMEVDLNLVEN